MTTNIKSYMSFNATYVMTIAKYYSFLLLYFNKLLFFKNYVGFFFLPRKQNNLIVKVALIFLRFYTVP